MKDVALSQQEQYICPQVAGCRQGCAGTAVVEGLPCPGWAEMPTRNPTLQGSSNHPAEPWFWGVGMSEPAALGQPMGVMRAACSQPIHSHHSMPGCDPEPPGTIWRLENPPQKPSLYQQVPVAKDTPSLPPIIPVRGPHGSGPHKGYPQRPAGSGDNWHGQEMGVGAVGLSQ